VRTEAKIRKQKKDHEYRKAELQEAIITWSLTGLLLLIFFSGLAAVVYMSR